MALYSLAKNTSIITIKHMVIIIMMATSITNKDVYYKLGFKDLARPEIKFGVSSPLYSTNKRMKTDVLCVLNRQLLTF